MGKSKSWIENTIDTDESEKDGIVTEGKGVESDTGNADNTDKSIRVEGTDEGAKEILAHTGAAIKEGQRAMEGVSGRMDAKAGDMQRVEGDLSGMTQATEGDKAAIAGTRIESSLMDGTRSELDQAERACEDDIHYTTDAETRERDARTDGEENIRSQSQVVNAFKPRG